MEIFGIGGWEMLTILLILIIVAGPKRMLAWSYQLGKYIAIIRGMWAETAKQLQKELDSAGVDVQVPKELPTRQSIQKEISRQVAPITKPMDEIRDNLKVTADDVRRPYMPPKPSEIKAPAVAPKPAESNGGGEFGTWSGGKTDEPPKPD